VAGTYERGNEPPGSIKCGGISGLAEKLSASQEGLCSMQLISVMPVNTSMIFKGQTFNDTDDRLVERNRM
jgi:hypothetical protein